MDRRAFLTGLSAAAVAATLPLPALAEPVVTMGVDLASGPDLLAFAVGSPGEFNWQRIFAKTADEAIRIWLDDTGYAEDDSDCQPEVACERAPSWDKIPSPTPGDWIRAGFGNICARCSGETMPDYGARAIGDQCICEDCLELGDLLATGELDEVLDDLTNRIGNHGVHDTLVWLDRHKWSQLVPPEIWQRAVLEGTA